MISRKSLEISQSRTKLKKCIGAVGEITTAQKVELAHQLCQSHDSYSKSQVARALNPAHGVLYLHSKQAIKDKAVAVDIEEWYEQDDTSRHRKLAVLFKMGKSRVKREMRKYGISDQHKKKCYVYPSKASSVAPTYPETHRQRTHKKWSFRISL